MAGLATANGEAESACGRLDVEEAGEPRLGEPEVRRVSEFGGIERVVEPGL